MQKTAAHYELSASDLVGFLNCQHLTGLDRSVADGTRAKPKFWDPLLEILAARGSVHEKKFVEHLEQSGLTTVRIEDAGITDAAVASTIAAMQEGAAVIVQGALKHNGWQGCPDILRRVETPSSFGAWSYYVLDTKLARETKAGTILQLCLYSELLEHAQGVAPDEMHVVAPWSHFEPQIFRFADYAAFFRKAKLALEQSVASPIQAEIYPDPKDHCDICRWQETCDKRRRDDDHLCLVAGISKLQIKELRQRGVATMAALAGEPLPLSWKPDRGAAASYSRIREQARLQAEARETGERRFELLPVEPGFGLCLLPEPSAGDVFLDFEGDPYVGEHGLEYLCGYQFTDAGDKPTYRGDWALTRAEEKKCFERFVDFAMERWARYPDLHIYHYAPYEPAALKRLMGRYATREEEIDRMLRANLFVDLYSVVRRGIRASVERYSIKDIEPFFEFARSAALPDVRIALAAVQAGLELEDGPSISADAKATVLAYNQDDCRSASELRQWLESLRDGLVANGESVPRPQAGDGSPNEKITDWLLLINKLVAQLTADLPAEPAERTPEQSARWLLANILDWHRREKKAVWWEYFRLSGLSADDLLDERAGLSGLMFVKAAGGTAKAPIHRYRFAVQETDIRADDKLRRAGGEHLGSVVDISAEELTIDIKKRQDSVDIHPAAVFTHNDVDAQVCADALVRIAQHVVAHGILGGGAFLGARDLLMREPPRLRGADLRADGEMPLDAAKRLTLHIVGGVLPIQGPPGAGKTYTGAHMICALARQGKTVGITANSHKVIRNLIDEVIKVADKGGLSLQCCHKADEFYPAQHRLSFAKKSEDLLQALGSTVQIGGGTVWLWSRPDAFEAVDVLFVDEAAQMSLANVLAASQAARSVILLGDPQQLDQPMNGSHPEGTDVSSLHHILEGGPTIGPDKGLFLAETWRLHPDICAFTSELFYAGKLSSKPGLEQQVVKSTGPVKGTGLRYFPVEHSGNQNSSPEEAEAIAGLVKGILGGGTEWVDRDGINRPLGPDDILIITPYNAQVFEIQKRIPGARVGTVDKFQGQEAPIAIYSMATSSYADAPRGMEFLYSLNRFNVATSRAKCLSILVSSPQIFEAECRTPRQIQLANAYCRFLELAASPD
jgi:uncharacterized protein